MTSCRKDVPYRFPLYHEHVSFSAPTRCHRIAVAFDLIMIMGGPRLLLTLHYLLRLEPFWHTLGGRTLRMPCQFLGH